MEAEEESHWMVQREVWHVAKQLLSCDMLRVVHWERRTESRRECPASHMRLSSA